MTFATIDYQRSLRQRKVNEKHLEQFRKGMAAAKTRRVSDSTFVGAMVWLGQAAVLRLAKQAKDEQEFTDGIAREMSMKSAGTVV
jgi:hypothetical protein